MRINVNQLRVGERLWVDDEDWPYPYIGGDSDHQKDLVKQRKCSWIYKGKHGVVAHDPQCDQPEHPYEGSYTLYHGRPIPYIRVLRFSDALERIEEE